MSRRTMNDTWGKEDLTETIHDINDERRSKHRNKKSDRDRTKRSSRKPEDEYHISSPKEKRRDKDGQREERRENRDENDRHKRRERSDHDEKREKGRHDDRGEKDDRHKRREREGHNEARKKDNHRDKRRDHDKRNDRDEHRDKRREKDDHDERRDKNERDKRREKNGNREKRREKYDHNDRRERDDQREQRKETEDRNDRRRERDRDDRDKRDSNRDKRRDREKRDQRKPDQLMEDDDRRKDRRHRDKEDRHSRRDVTESRRKSRHADEEDGEHSRRTHDERRNDNDRRRMDKDSEEYRKYKEAKREKNKKTREKEEQHQQSNVIKQDYDYEDEEFEDYDDDFEDDVSDEAGEILSNVKANPEMSELARAIAEENRRAASGNLSSRYGSASSVEKNSPRSENSFSRLQANNDDSSVESSQRNSPASFINFMAASKKAASSKMHSKVRKRMNDLRSIISLDMAAFDLFEMEPVTEYSVYMKNFGSSNTKQVSVQCNDDNLDQESQTDTPEINEKWSQHPPHDVKVSGDGLNQDIDEDYNQRMMRAMQADSKRLNKFLINSCNLVRNLLTEEQSWLSSTESKNQSSFSFCESCNKINTNLGYLQGRKVVHAAFSPVAHGMLIAVAFEPASNEYSTRVDRKGVIVVWDVRKPNSAEKVLICDAMPTYCCFSPLKSHLLFVGTEDGCVLAFDLKEPSAHHQVLTLEKGVETALRSATYNTGCIDGGHASPIKCITPVSNSVDSSLVSDDYLPDSIDSGLAFQLASLEEMGFLCIWVVIESNVDLDTEQDLGLSPHGKVRLIKTTKINIQPPVKSSFPDLTFQVSCISFLPTDVNHFFIGLDTGHIAHMTQYTKSSEKKSPTQYLYSEANSLSGVTCMDLCYNPLANKTFLLSGYADGTLQLYATGNSTPLLVWPYTTEGHEITLCKWSTCRPSVFYVLDCGHQLHIWDLVIQTSGPIKTEDLSSKNLTQFCLSNPNIQKDLLKTKPEVAFVYNPLNGKQSSAVEIHSLSAHFSNPVENEFEEMLNVLQCVM